MILNDDPYIAAPFCFGLKCMGVLNCLLIAVGQQLQDLGISWIQTSDELENLLGELET